VIGCPQPAHNSALTSPVVVFVVPAAEAGDDVIDDVTTSGPVAVGDATAVFSVMSVGDFNATNDNAHDYLFIYSEIRTRKSLKR